MRSAPRWSLRLLAALAVLAVVALILLYAGVSVAGPVNDVANAAIGWCAVLLTGCLVVGRRTEPASVAAVLLSLLGAVGLSWGTWLVLTGTTGFYLAGLVSGLGVAALGGWLLIMSQLIMKQMITNRLIKSRLITTPVRLGRLTGAIMLLGVLGLPAVLAGVDDPSTAPWYAWAAGVGWLGLYLLLPVWCVRTARHAAKSGE